MSDEMPDLDPELASLLTAERKRGPAPASAQEGVRAGLAAVLANAQLGRAPKTPHTNEPAPGQADGAPSTAPSTDRAPLAQGLQKFIAAHAGAIALGTFVVGAATGAWLRGAGPKEVVYVDRPVSTSFGEAQTPAVPSSSQLAKESALHAIPVETLPSASPSASARSQVVQVVPEQGHEADAGRTIKSTDNNLRAEQALVETGRTALLRGNHASALAALNRHAAEFPNGQLAEEREALAIQALVASQRKQEAAERGARFRLRYRNSVMLPVVDDILR